MHCSENCQSETSSIVNNREQFVKKDRWKYQFTEKRSMWKFQSVSFFFRCKVEVSWRIAGLFLYCLLDYPSHGQEQTGFCVLGLGTTLLALQRGWKSCKSISASKQFATCSPCSWRRIINILKMFKTLVYIQPAKRRGEDQWEWSTGLQIQCFIFFLKVFLRLLMTYLKLLVLTSDINLACWLSAH